MLHVLIKTKDMGMRKAWFICPTETAYGEPAAVIVYKNNNKEKPFEVVAMDRVHLDIEFRAEAEPVRENTVIDNVRTLRDVNRALRKKRTAV